MNQTICPRVTSQFPSGSVKKDSLAVEEARKVIERIGKRRYLL